MNCKQCKLVEMLIMARNDKEIIYQCPKCKTIENSPIEENRLNDKVVKNEKG